MREIEQRVCAFGSLKLQSGYALLAFQTPESFSALVGIHLKKEKSCLKKRPTSLYIQKGPELRLEHPAYTDTDIVKCVNTNGWSYKNKMRLLLLAGFTLSTNRL